jgi:hypothetical protein
VFHRPHLRAPGHRAILEVKLAADLCYTFEVFHNPNAIPAVKVPPDAFVGFPQHQQ